MSNQKKTSTSIRNTIHLNTKRASLRVKCILLKVLFVKKEEKKRRQNITYFSLFLLMIFAKGSFSSSYCSQKMYLVLFAGLCAVPESL